MRARWGPGLVLIAPALCIAVPLAAAAFVLAGSGARSPGFGGIDDEIYAFPVFGPVLIGSLIGTAFGWWTWRRS